MKTTLIINAIPNPTNLADVQEYLSKVMPLFRQHGGTKIERYQTTEQLMGTSGVKMVGIFEFDDIDHVKTMMASDAFKALGELRAKAFSQLDLLTCKPF